MSNNINTCKVKKCTLRITKENMAKHASGEQGETMKGYKKGYTDRFKDIVERCLKIRREQVEL